MEKQIKTGADKFRWNLSLFYSGIDDSHIDADLKIFYKKAKKFQSDYKGRLAKKLGKALSDYSEIRMLAGKLGIYLYLAQSTDVTNSVVKAKISEVDNLLNMAEGKYLTYFEIELKNIKAQVLKKLYAKDSIVKKHRPYIEYIRMFKSNMLTEEVESALTKRSQFGSGAWSEFFDECEADLEFTFNGEKKTLTEMLHILTESNNQKERFEAMTIINSGLKGSFAKYSAQNLYMVTGSSAVEYSERKYKNPMAYRNKSSQIPDKVVDTLHIAVQNAAAPLAQRYYRLKAMHLGLKILRWSDRNAPMPFSDKTEIPFDEAIKIVIGAFESFSPTLASLIKESIKSKKIDAPAIKGKRSGAFNCSIVLPGNIPVSFTFLNYLGSNRDVMTLAHELGHSVHGLLAGKTQGVLMSQAPIAYCETASVFGEMMAFNFLKKRLLEKNDKKALLALLMGKIDDMLNTTVRQIGFSNFERRIHGIDSLYKNWHEPKKLSVEELNKIWLETLEMFYEDSGKIFTYENAEYFWTYVSHFHRPFYVYGYAFGEFLTQSLYAKQKSIGNKFESLYLDLLKSGMTKNVTKLLKPFGLDPTDENFWIDGINISLGKMIEEAEQLSRDMGVLQ